jgi:Domain of unknown function (DUF4307)
VSDAAERLRRRYPQSRVPRPLLVVAIGVGVAVALGWLIWAALFHSRPAVAAQVSAFTVVSDTAIDVTLTVDRRDPAQPVTCRVLAQAGDFSPVGEQQVVVAATTARVVNQKLTLVTLRRAVTATVEGCTVD